MTQPIEIDLPHQLGREAAKQRIEGDDRIPAVRIQVNGVSSRVAVMRRTGVAA